MLNNPLKYIDPTGHWCVSADGKWAHPGGCNDGITGQERFSGPGYSPDYEHDGDLILRGPNFVGPPEKFDYFHSQSFVDDINRWNTDPSFQKELSDYGKKVGSVKVEFMIATVAMFQDGMPPIGGERGPSIKMVNGRAVLNVDGGGTAGKSNKIENAVRYIKEYLGPGARTITNSSGDKIFISADGKRRVRFDINNPSPHNNPHAHVEELVNGKWVKSGQIYPYDVPHN